MIKLSLNANFYSHVWNIDKISKGPNTAILLVTRDVVERETVFLELKQKYERIKGTNCYNVHYAISCIHGTIKVIIPEDIYFYTRGIAGLTVMITTRAIDQLRISDLKQIYKISTKPGEGEPTI